MSTIDYDLIHRYLLGELSPQEAAAFEQACVADPDLQAAVALERKVLAAVRYDGRRRLIATLQAPRKRPKPVTRTLVWGALGVAAAVVALLFILQVTGKSSSPQQLADEYFAMEGTQVLDDLLRGDPSRDSTALDKALGEYRQGHYQSAVTRLTPFVAPDSSSQARVYFLQGNCYYQLHLPQSAATLYGMAKDWSAKASSLHRSAIWHRSLALVQAGELALARQQLLQLQADHGPSLSTAMRDRIAALLAALP